MNENNDYYATGETVSLNDINPNTIVFNNTKNNENVIVLTIKPIEDSDNKYTIEFNKDVFSEVDGFAKEFIKIVEKSFLKGGK